MIKEPSLSNENVEDGEEANDERMSDSQELALEWIARTILFDHIVGKWSLYPWTNGTTIIYPVCTLHLFSDIDVTSTWSPEFIPVTRDNNTKASETEKIQWRWLKRNRQRIHTILQMWLKNTRGSVKRSKKNQLEKSDSRKKAKPSPDNTAKKNRCEFFPYYKALKVWKMKKLRILHLNYESRNQDFERKIFSTEREKY